MISFETVFSLLRDFKYPAMFAVLALSGMGLPVPEELTLAASGVAVGLQRADFVPASIACVLGIVASDAILFSLGRHFGDGIFRSRVVRWFLSERRRKRIRRFFDEHGTKTVFLARFFPPARVGVYLYAGQHGMRWPAFLSLNFLGASLSGPVTLFLAARAARGVSDHAHALSAALGAVGEQQGWLSAVVALAAMAGVACWVWRRVAIAGRGSHRPLLEVGGSARDPERGEPNGSALSHALGGGSRNRGGGARQPPPS